MDSCIVHTTNQNHCLSTIECTIEWYTAKWEKKIEINGLVTWVEKQNKRSSTEWSSWWHLVGPNFWGIENCMHVHNRNKWGTIGMYLYTLGWLFTIQCSHTLTRCSKQNWFVINRLGHLHRPIFEFGIWFFLFVFLFYANEQEKTCLNSTIDLMLLWL